MEVKPETKLLNRIKVILAEKMITNKELAEKYGLDDSRIYEKSRLDAIRKECREVTNSSQPSLENLIEIAKCLDCEINELVRM